jgi:hypothetical protein
MSENKKILNEIIDYIESSINEGLDKVEFIKEFRDTIENYLKENIT